MFFKEQKIVRSADTEDNVEEFEGDNKIEDKNDKNKDIQVKT